MKVTKYKLTDICDFQGGSQPPKKEWTKNKKEGYVRMLQIRDFTQSHKNNIEFVKDSNRIKKCKKDDVLIGRYGASIGKILTGLEGAYNVAIMKTIPDENKLDKQFLLSLLKAPKFQNFILKIGSRAAQAGFNKDDLSKFEIYIPSLTDQKRIAKVLSACETLISKRKESIELLDEFLKSTFLEMFGDPVLNEKGWEENSLGKICTKITDGTHHSPPILDKGIPYITAKHIKENKVDFFSKPWYISEEDHKNIYARCNPVKGDILYIKDGATTGKSAINPYDFEFSLLSSVALLKTNNKILDSDFLNAWLNSPIVKQRIIAKMAGGAIKRLTLTKIKKIKILIPPITNQKEFGLIVEKNEKIKAKYQTSLEELEQLYGSISQQAFAGELDFKKDFDIKKFKLIIVGASENKGEISENDEPKKGLKKISLNKMGDGTQKLVNGNDDVKETKNTYRDTISFTADDKKGKEESKNNIGQQHPLEFLIEQFQKNEFEISEIKTIVNNKRDLKDNYFYYDYWKEQIFNFIDATPPLITQVFNDKSGSIKLKLTDEAYKA